MNSSGGRVFVQNSVNNFASCDNKIEELNWNLFNFNNGVESQSQSHFLDSPSFLFNSNIDSSPGGYYGLDFKEENITVSDFTSSISRNIMEESTKSQVVEWDVVSQPKDIDFSMEINKIEPESVHSPQALCNFDSLQASKEQGRFEDGYHWRKYGQKQVKGSKKPRSYYRCSYPNCLTKKKVEKDLNGYITEIIYKGKHNHTMLQNMKKSSFNSFQDTTFDHSLEKNRYETFSNLSFGKDEHEQEFSNWLSDNDSEHEPKAKRWKLDEMNSESSGSRTVQQPKVVIETKSEIDILDDGYKWRKYGQKVVKGNPNPRSYYKCTNTNCHVRKLVERASHDLQAVITTYEGKHNHDLPKQRTVGSQPPTSSNSSTKVHGTSELTTYKTQIPHIIQILEHSKNNSFVENSYVNQDWTKEKLLATTKEEPSNDLIYNSPW